MTRKALVIGIDEYPSPNELGGCVNDAVQIASLLRKNGDGSPNFEVKLITAGDDDASTVAIDEAIRSLFSGQAETAVLYFAGHGLLDDEVNEGYLVSQNGQPGGWGISLSGVLHLANKAHPKISSSVIMLDCCHAGFAGELSGLGTNGQISVIGNGLTILSASHREQAAGETDGHGTFTRIAIDGLEGAASDVLGRITPAALYAHVDQTLGGWDQRPIYKANVHRFVSLRETAPKVSKEILRKLPDYFPTASHVLELNPTFEPDRGEEAERLASILAIDENVKVYRDLQKCHQHGIIQTLDYEYMWHTAIFSGRCRLTAVGAHYRRLAEKGMV